MAEGEAGVVAAEGAQGEAAAVEVVSAAAVAEVVVGVVAAAGAEGEAAAAEVVSAAAETEVCGAAQPCHETLGQMKGCRCCSCLLLQQRPE